MSKEKDIFEDLIRKKLTEHESAVPDHLWANISSSLPPAGVSGGASILANVKIWIAAASIAAVSTVVYLTTREKAQNPTVSQVAETTSSQGTPPSAAPAQENNTTSKTPEEVRTVITHQTVVSPPEIDAEPAYYEDATDDIKIETKGPAPEAVANGIGFGDEDPSHQESKEPSQTISSPSTGFSVVPGNESGMLYFFIPGDHPEGNVEWDFGDGSTSDNPSPAHEYAEVGSYKVQQRVKNQKGEVMSSDSVEVRAYNAPRLILPTIFTPNGDGHNDQFDVLGASKGIDEIVRISVKTLGGRTVYEGNNPLWNGEDQSGTPLQTDNYVVEVIARSSEGKIVSKNAIVWLQRN